MDAASLRSLLNEVLISDSDFGGFCHDYFPEAYKRFSNSMDRVQKTTIFLEQIRDYSSIAARLDEYLSRKSKERLEAEGLLHTKIGAFISLSAQRMENIRIENCSFSHLIPRQAEASTGTVADRPDYNSPTSKVENLFQQINFLYIKFKDLLGYDLATNAAGELLPAVVNERRVVKFTESMGKFKRLVSSCEQAFEECQTTYLKASYRLTDQDRISIEAYLRRFSSFLEIINKNLTLLTNLAEIGPAQIAIIFDTNKHIQLFHGILYQIENEKKSIETNLRNYEI